MKVPICPREQELMEIVSCERWPDRCPDELHTHITGCAICTDVLEVALALHEDREIAHVNAQIPSAGLVWWRAELRARQEAIRTVSRPMTLVEAFSAAAGIGVAAALLVPAWSWLKTFFVLPDFSALSASHLGLVIGFALAVLVIAPLAMYLVLSDE